MSDNVFAFNSDLFNYDFVPKEHIIRDLFTISGRRQDLYDALHVNTSTKDPIYEFSSERVKQAISSDFMIDYSHYYDLLIQENFPLLVAAGEYDMLDGAKAQETWLKLL